jgi:thiamine-monophosphate kinase
MDSTGNRTEVNTLGEFGLIQQLTAEFEQSNATTVLGIGDDAAVLDPMGKQIVISTDLLVEGVHFDMMYTPLHYLGYKAISVNVSDIYAMCATPTQVTVSIAFSNRYSVQALDALYAGIKEACDFFEVDLIGGDTTTSTKGLTISVTAIGEVVADKYVTRSGAQINDLICVSGDLGAAYLGLLLLEREKQVYIANPQAQPDFGEHQYCIKRLLKPIARKDITQLLTDADITPTAMIDISDGLSSEILHICNSSKKGCVLYEDKIPIDPQAKQLASETFNIDYTTATMNGGEDYELLFTINQTDYEKIKDSEFITVIGYITDAEHGRNLVSKAGSVVPIVAQGFNHLA